MTDVLGCVPCLDTTRVHTGYNDTHRTAEVCGYPDARDHGVSGGCGRGLQVGYYAGCLKLLRRMQLLDCSLVPDRAELLLSALEQLLDTYPTYDSQDVRLQDVLEQLHKKFKVLAALLGKSQACLPLDAFGPIYKY